LLFVKIKWTWKDKGETAKCASKVESN